MKTERGNMEYIGVLLVICAVCVIGVVFLWARSQENSPSELALVAKTLGTRLDKFDANPPVQMDTVASLNTRLDTAIQNVSMLRLEIESLKSKIDFPQKQEMILKQDKVWEVHLVPERPARKKTTKLPFTKGAGVVDLPVGKQNKVTK